MTQEKPNLADLTKKFFEEKIANGYQIKDRNSVIDLTNEAMDTLKIPRGSYGRTKKILSKVLVEQKIVIKGQGLKGNDNGSLQVELTGQKPAPAPQPTIQTTATQTTQQQGFLGFAKPTPTTQTTTPQPTQQQEQKQQLPPLTEQDKPRYQRRMNKFVSLGQKLYLKFGIITEEQKQQLEKDYTEFSDDLADYCIENNVRLPKYLELYLIVAQGAILFIVPLFKWLFKPKKKEETKEEKPKS